MAEVTQLSGDQVNDIYRQLREEFDSQDYHDRRYEMDDVMGYGEENLAKQKASRQKVQELLALLSEEQRKQYFNRSR